MLARPEMAERNDALQQIRVLITDGGYEAGDRLPPERELIERLGVSRNSLRKGLETLEREGVIWRQVGKGTFVAAREGADFYPRLTDLTQQVTPVQMMRARLSVEPAIAREAAANASADVVARLENARDRSLEAASWDSYEEADDSFHRCIAEATGNILLLSIFDHLNQVRRAVSWQKVVRASTQPSSSHPSFQEHEIIFAAIVSRDPSAAHAAMREHLNSVAARLYGDS